MEQGALVYGRDGRTAYALHALELPQLLASGGQIDAVLADLLDAGGEAAIGPDDLDELALFDYELILTQFAQMRFGDQVDFDLRCMACKTRYRASFSLSTMIDLFKAEIEQAQSNAAIDQAITLPSRALLRALGNDKTELARKLSGHARDMSTQEQDAIEAAAQALCPMIAETIESHCPACGRGAKRKFILSQWAREKFLAEFRRALEDFHLIASAYHWAPADILALPAPMRRAFAARLKSAPPVS